MRVCSITNKYALISSSLKFRQTNTFLENETLTPEHPKVLEVGLVTGEYLIWSFCLGTQYFQKFPMITQDLSRRCIATSGESVSTYPRRPKAEAFSNAVDVVERLRDPTDPSTERTAPPRSAHVQLGDVPRTLDPVEAEGEFRQHDGVVTVMMKLPAQGFA